MTVFIILITFILVFIDTKHIDVFLKILTGRAMYI